MRKPLEPKSAHKKKNEKSLKIYKKTTVAIAVSTSMFVSISTAHAAGFALKEQSAYGQGSSFAGVSAGGAISTSFWNPANISEVGENSEIEGMISLVDGDTDIETTGASNFIYRDLNENQDESDLGVLPAIYYASRINNKTAWGLSFTVPYGLGSEVARGSRSQYVALESEAQSFNLSPTVTFEAAPGFNFGLGLQVQTFDVTLSQALPIGATAGVFSANDPVLEITGDDSSALGYTLGFNYANKKTSFGIGYRSSIDHDLEGSFSVDAFGLDAPVTVDLETPSLLSLGFKQKLGSKWELGATYNKTDWSVVGTIPVISQQSGAPIVFNGRSVALPFEYRDTTFTSIGADYKYSDKTSLRAGIGIDETVATDTTRTTRIPDTDRYWLSFGGSHQLAKGQIDWGFTHVFLKDEAEINIGPGHAAFTGLPYTGTADPKVNIISVAYKRKF